MIMNCRTLKRTFGLPLAAVWIGLAVSASGATPGFLLIDGIPGESAHQQFAGWIDIHDFEQSVAWHQADDGVHRPGFDGLRIRKSLDKATPALMNGLSRGEVYPSATLAFVLAGADQARFYQMELGNVSVTALEVGGLASDRPDEELSLVFDYIEWTYTEFDLRGRPLADHTAYWDLVVGDGGSDVIRHGFQITATRAADGEMRLRWAAVSGKSYQILQSTSVAGPYLLREVITPDGETGEIALPTSSLYQFFLVEEEP
jgi:type VI secretion system secreted protein Hcp